VVLLLGVTLSVALFAPAAGAQDDDPATDRRIVSLEAEYLVHPSDGVIAVTETIEVRNVRPASGGYITVWVGHLVRVPSDAEDVVVTSNGDELNTEVLEENDLIRFISADFPTDLYFGQSRTLEVTYTLPSYGLSADGDRRISESRLRFELIVCCDFEDVTARVVIPRSFTVTPPFQAGFEEAIEGGNHVFTYQADEFVSGEFTEYVVTAWLGFDPSGLVRTDVTLAGGTVGVISEPDDPAWRSEFVSLVGDLGNSLAQTTGAEWTLKGLAFHQGGDGSDLPTGGWQDSSGEIIWVGDYQPRDIALTLAHQLVPDLPLVESGHTTGLVHNLAAMALAESGDSWIPRQPVGQIDTDGEWHWLSRQITDEIGVPGWQDLAAAAASDASFLAQDVPPEGPVAMPADWRRVIDAASQTPSAATISELVEAWLLDEDEAEELAERRALLDDLASLRSDLGDLPVPVGIREAISQWDLTQAGAMLEAGSDALTDLDTAREAAQAYGFSFPLDASGDWGSATQPDQLRDIGEQARLLMQQATAIGEREVQLTEDRGLVANLGFDQGQATSTLQQARTSFGANDMTAAAAAVDQFDQLSASAGSSGRNTLLLIGAVPTLLVVAIAAIVIKSRRSANPRDDNDQSHGDDSSSGDSSGATDAAEGESEVEIIDLADRIETK